MQEYSNDKITVRYDEKICIHARKVCPRLAAGVQREQ